MKKFIAVFLAFVLLTVGAAVVRAESDKPNEVMMPEKKGMVDTRISGIEKIKDIKISGIDKKMNIKISGTEKRMESLKERAMNEIERRITSLTDLSSRIANMKKLSDTQKNTLKNNVQSQIDVLNSLKTKIQGDTDIDNLREDVKSITSLYRIYLIYMPATRIIVAGEALLNSADKLSDLAGKLRTRIDEAKANGANTADTEALLADMLAKIADARTQANSAISTATAIQPTGYPGNMSGFQTARKYLAAARKDLNEARVGGTKIFVSLKKFMNKTTITPSAATATPTAGTTATPSAVPSPTSAE